MWCFLNVQIIWKLSFYLVVDLPCFWNKTLHEVILISWIQFALLPLFEILCTVQVIDAVSSFGQTFFEFSFQIVVSLWCKSFYYERSATAISFLIFNRYKICLWIFNTTKTQSSVILLWMIGISLLSLEFSIYSFQT